MNPEFDLNIMFFVLPTKRTDRMVSRPVPKSFATEPTSWSVSSWASNLANPLILQFVCVHFSLSLYF